MSDIQTITPFIYKIDLEKVSYFLVDKNLNVDVNNAHEHILAYHAEQRKQGASKAKAYQKKLGPLIFGQYKVTVYGTDSTTGRPHQWQNLFGEKIENIDIKYPNLAAFISTKDACYAISAGQGQTLFEPFVDITFPLEIAKHIMKPEVNATERREIAGAVYGQMQQFRTSQMIMSSQVLGTVWRTLKGEVAEEIKVRSDFDSIFKPDRRSIGVVANSSLTIRKSISIDKMIELLDWLMKLQQEALTPKQEEHFSFLNSLKEISPRKGKSTVAELEIALCEQLLTTIRNNGLIDFDYSHRHFARYQEAQRYCFSKKIEGGEWDEPPTATEVLNVMLNGGEFDNCQNGSDCLDVLNKIVFTAEHEDETFSTHASVLAHLHGEVQYKNKRYFLVDGKWYVAQAEFIKRLAEDFKKLLLSDHFAADPNLQLSDCKADFTEGKYNDSYLNSDSWLVGDRIFIENVEIADLIYFYKDKVYIIHNKFGFGVTVRDVCSQVLLSMNLMNRMKDDATLLGQYYDRIISQNYPQATPSISRKEFIDKILKTSGKNITYVIGYISKKPVQDDLGSNIARFEAVKLCDSDRRVFDFDLKITYIPKVNN